MKIKWRTSLVVIFFLISGCSGEESEEMKFIESLKWINPQVGFQSDNFDDAPLRKFLESQKSRRMKRGKRAAFTGVIEA